MSTSASVVFWIIVGSGIALVAVVVAVVFAQQQVGDVYARERTALFAGMLRKGSTALPAAAIEVRNNERDADLVAVYDDGALVRLLKRGRRVSVHIATSAEARMDAEMQRFRDAVAAQGFGPAASASSPMPSAGMVVAHGCRGDTVLSSAPAALDDVQRGRHSLSDAWRASEPLRPWFRRW